MRAWYSLQAWQDESAAAHAVEGAVALPAVGSVLAGACGLCGSRRGFAAGTGAGVDPREGLRCLACGCNARQRAAATVLLEAMAGATAARGARAYLGEQASPLFVALRRKLPGLQGSEFATGLVRRLRMSAWLWRHGVPGWIRHRDITALGFATAGLDAVASLDVLEHVPRYEAALAEFARVLRPGGVLVSTVPFYEAQARSETIARLRDDGLVEFSGAPEYHGDPRGGGVPCFHHFGWDLVGALRQAGFTDAAMVRAWRPDAGLPRGVWVLRALR
ncbi:class I SAM-dependent methyltransferase [Pseudoxanthomonas koreensis]|uniref:class I SAM-dependent methyltransferase n=1 Tax=Pseudoxanthomonas koreensis TaxID=266061 RepID=UPI001390B0A9|nr:methyltransferase domain-containing protein [Pseudoxanthomonas koreensis]KAF1694254.1 hypothetical protein CSC64_04335 [Pseudoxanthomonas koreensis]